MEKFGMGSPILSDLVTMVTLTGWTMVEGVVSAWNNMTDYIYRKQGARPKTQNNLRDRVVCILNPRWPLLIEICKISWNKQKSVSARWRVSISQTSLPAFFSTGSPSPLVPFSLSSYYAAKHQIGREITYSDDCFAAKRLLKTPWAACERGQSFCIPYPVIFC